MTTGRPTADELDDVYGAAWPHRGQPPLGLGDRLVALCDAARAEMPDLAIDDVELVRAIARHAPEDDARGAIARTRGGELALADAASRGSADAIALLERTFGSTITAVCERFVSPDHAADDLRQILRAHLFVATGRPAKVAEFNGLGSLGGWLRVVATRLFIDLGRSAGRARELLSADTVAGAVATADLALDTIKAELRDAVVAAMLAAVDELEPADRQLLRQHLVHGLTIDQLGAALGVHRATAARRVARARERLAERTRELLAAQLGEDGPALEEVFGLVMSKLDVSIRTLLASRPVRPP